MKWFQRLPVLLRVILFLGACEFLVFVSQFFTGFFAFRGPLATNLLIGVMVLLLTYLVRRAEGLTWEEVGLGGGIGRLAGGMLIGIGMLLAVAFVIKVIMGFQWQLNPCFEWAKLPLVFIMVFCSAVAQELAFRGYPFFLLLRKWGEWPTQLITAFFFGCMHLSGGMKWQEMLMVMFTTGLGSLLFGMATIRTRRLYLAAGIHFGWNLTQYLLPRSIGENGAGIWMVSGGVTPWTGPATYIIPYAVIVAAIYFIIRANLSTT
jgi:membrane protease YdiL (CAAX protease family)